MSHLKTEGTLIKSIHYTGEQPEEFDPMKPCFSDDLTPLTGYSLNKRRRWELQNKVGHQMMEDLQKFHGNTPDKILFLERVNLKTFEWKYPYYAYEKRKANWKDFQQDIKDGIREHYNGTDLRKMK
uniref:LHH domain-containing protein n=1 Tax=Caenorhabditis tropicalis TaxID=1561998 RepID=A0A1I7TLM5_9PELO